MKAHASKVGKGGLQPLTIEKDTSSKVDDVLLAQRERGRQPRNMDPDNGSVAAPIKGTKVSGATKLKGGRL